MPELDYLHFLHQHAQKLSPHQMCMLLEQYLLIYSDPDQISQVPVFEMVFGKLKKELQDSKYEVAETNLQELGFHP